MRHTQQATVTSYPLQFTGHAEDPDTGMVYTGARMYDPSLARFTGADPAPIEPANPRSFTRYGYGNNNPYRNVDPDGESPIDIAFLAADTLKLSLAIYSGNAAAIESALGAEAASLVGVFNPIPFSGQAMKAAVFASRIKAAEKGIAGVEKVVKEGAEIEKAVGAGKRAFSTADRTTALEKAKDASGIPRCQYCGSKLHPKAGRPNSYEADHTNPYSRGGPSTPENLTPSCRTCNRSKGAQTPEEWSRP